MSESSKPHPRARDAALLAAAIAALAVLSVPAASASYDPLASGTTTLTLDSSFAALLHENGVGLRAGAPARFRAGKASFPIIGGEIDPTLNKGTVQSEGTLRFVAGQRSVPLRAVMLKIKPAPLYAKVGGGQLKLAGAAHLNVERAGFGTRFSATHLRLTSKFATRLNKKLHLKRRPLKPGQLIGTVVATSQPSTAAVLARGKATLVPSPDLLRRFNELHVSLNPIFPAELTPGPIFSLPLLAGSRISPDGRAGTIRLGGALEFLQLGAGQLFWREPWLELGLSTTLAEADVEPNPPFPGKLGQVSIADLSQGTVAFDPQARTVTISAASFTLNAQSAATFNEAFAKPQERADVFHAGELFGTASFTAQGQ